MVIKNGDAVIMDDGSVYAVIKTCEYENANYALVQLIPEDVLSKRELNTDNEIIQEVIGEDEQVKFVPVKDAILKNILTEKLK